LMDWNYLPGDGWRFQKEDFTEEILREASILKSKKLKIGI